MVTAVATGEAFARSPTFIIDGQEVSNPCTEALPAAPCIVDFLKKQGVDRVVARNIGPNTLRLLEERGISVENMPAGNSPQKAGAGGGSFNTWLENKAKFLGFTALTIGVAWVGYKLYRHLKAKGE